MQSMFVLVIVALLVVSSLGFMAVPGSATRSSVRYMAMKGKASNVASNLSRKFKRQLRTVDATTFSSLYTPQFEDFLLNKASPGIYNSVYQKLEKTARQLKVPLKANFGVRPKVERPDLVDTAVAAGTFATLVAAVKAAGLVDALKGPLMTVLAPTDDAFAKLEPGTVEGLLADIPKLQAVLKYHVIEGSNNSKKVVALNGQSIKTLHGGDLSVKVAKQDGTVTIGTAKVVQADIKCKNGVIHVIDSVLIPPQ